MKPAQARRLREAREAAQAARGEALEAFLRTGEPADTVRPELIPGAAEHREASRQVREAVSRAARVDARKYRKAVEDVRRATLFRLSFVSPEDLERLRARMAGRSEVETG
jgi:hypothetical protein